MYRRGDGKSKSKYHSIASAVLEVGVAACPTPAEELVVPVQVSRDLVCVNAYLDLLSEWLSEPECDIKDDCEQVDGCTDIEKVETFPNGKQNHPDYIQPETYLQAYPPIMNKEQIWNMYPRCFNGIDKFKVFEYHITLEDMFNF